MSPTTDTLFLDALACRGVLASIRYWRARHRLEQAARCGQQKGVDGRPLVFCTRSGSRGEKSADRVDDRPGASPSRYGNVKIAISTAELYNGEFKFLF